MTRSGIRRSCPKVTCQLLLDKRSNLLRKPILEYCLTFKHRRRASIPFSPYNGVNFAGEVPWLCIFHTLLRRHIRYFFLRRIPQGKPMLYVPHYSRERERQRVEEEATNFLWDFEPLFRTSSFPPPPTPFLRSKLLSLSLSITGCGWAKRRVFEKRKLGTRGLVAPVSSENA